MENKKFTIDTNISVVNLITIIGSFLITIITGVYNLSEKEAKIKQNAYTIIATKQFLEQKIDTESAIRSEQYGQILNQIKTLYEQFGELSKELRQKR
jgi:hypothetical protein